MKDDFCNNANSQKMLSLQNIVETKTWKKKRIFMGIEFDSLKVLVTIGKKHEKISTSTA